MTMLSPLLQNRLSQIETVWTILFDAHGDADTAGAARHQILLRYGDAVRRYLGGALRDEPAADETFQDFALRLLRGDYAGVHPEKGRYRSFLKTVLSRLVADHYRKQSRRREQGLPNEPTFGDAAAEHGADADFCQMWRDELLTRVWTRLADEEVATKKPWMTVLRLRVELPKLRSAQLALLLGEKIGQPVTATGLRVLLHRSREKFAAYLIDVVTESIDNDDWDAVEQELAELQLLQYCQAALGRRRAAASVTTTCSESVGSTTR